MTIRRTVRRTLLGHDVAVAYAVIIALYFARSVRVQPLQIPGYLLIATYDIIEVVLPFLTPYHSIVFPLFLYLLAVVGAGMARWLGHGHGDGSVSLRTVSGVCIVMGALSILFGGMIGGPLVAPTDNPTPLAIVGMTGIVFLGFGWWLLRRPSKTPRKTVGSES